MTVTFGQGVDGVHIALRLHASQNFQLLADASKCLAAALVGEAGEAGEAQTATETLRRQLFEVLPSI